MTQADTIFKSSPTASRPSGRFNSKRVDATTDADIAQQKAQDDAHAMLDAGVFAKNVRVRLGLTQPEFAQALDVSLATIRNWEQGKRGPTGAAKALLKILNLAPEAAIKALRNER